MKAPGRIATLALLAAAVFATPAHASRHQIAPNVDQLARLQFSLDSSQPLEVVAGSWDLSGPSDFETWNSRTAAPSLSTITEYDNTKCCGTQTDPEFNDPQFTYRAQLRTRGATAQALAGLVYLYKDPSNYYEVVFSATGTAQMRRVLNGVRTTLASATYREGGKDVWFDAEVVWSAAETIVRVNGIRVFAGIKQTAQTSGRVGMSSYGAQAQFGYAMVTVPARFQPFRHDFSSGTAPGWTPQTGQWSVAGGTYNSSVQPVAMTFAPFTPYASYWLTFRARMLNPAAGAANQVGMVFNYRFDPSIERTTYHELVFLPNGIARINQVTTLSASSPGSVFTLATDTYDGGSKSWFDVAIGRIGIEDAGNVLFVMVNGKQLFKDGPVPNFNHQQQVGLITHSSAGKFDNVQLIYQPLALPYQNTFDAPLDPATSAGRGDWAVQGGTLNNTSLAADNTLIPAFCPQMCAHSNFRLRVRMLNPYGATGNLIGLMFNANADPRGNHYEVVFSQAGQAFIRKKIRGQTYIVATASHAIARNVWFDVELLRSGAFTTVKVNGQTLFDRVATGQLADIVNTSRGIGLITHWSTGRFDDLRFEGTN